VAAAFGGGFLSAPCVEIRNQHAVAAESGTAIEIRNIHTLTESCALRAHDFTAIDERKAAVPAAV
jgi:hypothetical protein